MKQLLGHNVNKLTKDSLNKIRLVYQKIIQDSYLLGKHYNNKSDVLTKHDVDVIYDITRTSLKKLFGLIKFNGKIKEDFFDLFSELDYIDFEDLDEFEVEDLLMEFPELEDELDEDLLDELYMDALSNYDTDKANAIQQMKLDPELTVLSTVKSGDELILTIEGPDGIKFDITIPISKIDSITSDSTSNALNKGTLSNSSLIVQFVTRRDDKVCPICEDLDMEQFDVDPISRSIDGPTIPDDTHPNCRCRYLSLDEDEELLVG